MSLRAIEGLQRYLRRLCAEAAPSEDAVLLHRFTTANDREAFERLMARHGPMVLGTARRLVNNTHDAEDVFQAVFVSLARLAKTIREGGTLPAWLHKTTCRVAARLRAKRLVLMPAPPERCEQGDPAAGLAWREVCQALDEELQRLPERLRSPLLLCYLSGLTRDEAAQRLGWSLGTLKRRLEQGRTVLRGRLARRGIAAVGLALTVLPPEKLQAAVSQALLDSTRSLVSGAAAVVPAGISALVTSSGGTMIGIAMKSMLALLTVIALGMGLYMGTGQADPPEQAVGSKAEDKPVQAEKVAPVADDPLPPGSTLRFGTARFRLGVPVSTLAVSADGQLAVAANRDHLLGAARAFDLVSGRVLYTTDRSPGSSAVEVAAISPDKRTVVTKQNFSLHIRDAQTGRELRQIELPSKFTTWSQNDWLAVTPDGKAIAVTSQGGVIHLLDFESGKTIRNFSNDNPESLLGPGWTSVLGIAFSADGKLMASGGFVNEKGNYFARLWELQTGKELRRFRHGKFSYGIPSLAFSPDARTLGTRAHDGRLRLFDVDTGKELRAFPPDGGGRRLGTVAFSPDGKTVAAAGDSVRLYDVTTGAERLRIDRKQATGLQFTDGGKTLVGAVMGTIYRWDTATGKALIPEGGDSIVEQILVTADGSRVVTRGQNGDAHIWDGTTGNHLRAVQASWHRGLALSPDGRFLVWPVTDESVRYTVPNEPRAIYHGSRLRLYDVAADKLVDRFPGFKGDAEELMFTSDGKRLATIDHRNAVVRFWNVEAGKEERSFQAVPAAERQRQHRVSGIALTGDGKLLAVASNPADTDRGGARPRYTPHLVRVWDMANGQMKQEFLDGPRGYGMGMALSPDGRLLATAGEGSPVIVWDALAGRKVATLPDGSPTGASAVRFSNDGRYLATALAAGALEIWEVATWTRRSEFKGHGERPTCLTFTPTGRLLSGSLDTTVLAWDTRPPRVAPAVTLEKAWHNLAARAAGESLTSEGKFLAAPADTVKLFADKIKPAEAVDPRRIERWLADLGSNQFAVREAASQALHGLATRQAIPYLEKALKKTESLEVRRRVQQLLAQHQRAELTPEQVRQVRAVMVLELIGDAESRNLLRSWAGGPEDALLTTEACLALQRSLAR